MILSLYFGFLAFAVVLLLYGTYAERDVFRIIGFTMILLLGIVLEPGLPGSVQYESGFNETVQGNTTSRDIQYTDYTNHGLSFWVMLIGILGLIVVMLERRESGQ